MQPLKIKNRKVVVMEQSNELMMVKEIMSGIEEKKGQQPVVMDLRGISTLCDYFVICSAPSVRQVKAIAEQIKDQLEKKEFLLRHQEGFREARWILLDYGDVVVHVFVTEDRDHYQLETIWKDAPIVDIDTA
jgi:ribosome-associated protein